MLVFIYKYGPYFFRLMKNFIHLWIKIFFVTNTVLSQNNINNYYTFNFPVSAYNGLIYENDSIVLSGILTEWTNQYIGKGFYAKIDLSGEVLQFQKLNTNNNTPYRPYIHTFSKIQNGNYLDCGISDDSPKWRYSFLCKLNHNLDTLWFREFTHGDTLTQLVAKENIELPNKDCLLICEIWYLDTNHYGKGHDILVIQTDSMGNEKKRTVYGYPLGTGGGGNPRGLNRCTKSALPHGDSFWEAVAEKIPQRERAEVLSLSWMVLEIKSPIILPISLIPSMPAPMLLAPIAE